MGSMQGVANRWETSGGAIRLPSILIQGIELERLAHVVTQSAGNG